LRKGADGMVAYAKPIDHLIEALTRLPGIGKKTLPDSPSIFCGAVHWKLRNWLGQFWM